MNANELADDLDHVYELTNISECKSGADMLRQQQAEIEALKNELINLKIDVGHEVEKFEKLMEDFKIETYWRNGK